MVVAAFLGGACEDDFVVPLEPLLEVSPKRLDFGTVELTQDALLPLVLENKGAVPARLASVEVIDDCGGCFVTATPPSQVLGTQKLELDVRFRAFRLEVATGTVTIRAEDPKMPVHTVSLIGRGRDGRRPDLAVLPERVDFGFVPQGGVGVASFVIRSIGSADLLVDRVAIDPPSAPFSITTSTPTPARPGRLAPSAQASVGLRATLSASVTGTVSARVLIETNVLEEKNVPGRRGVVAVSLAARSNRPPVAVFTGPSAVEPRTRVSLDGSASHDQDAPPDLPLTYRWTLTPPSGSTSVLERANGAMPSFFTDISGPYAVKLVVVDALGLESAPATLVVDALPKNALRIELTWDHPESDLDLHLIREGSAFCSCDGDCHYRDCGRSPTWFPGRDGANPKLDIDDSEGFGPENINIDGEGPLRVVQDGRYRIAVHYYATNAGASMWPTTVSNATVRVYIYGLLAAELTHAMTAEDQVWYAGFIEWPARVVTTDGSTQEGVRCGLL